MIPGQVNEFDVANQIIEALEQTQATRFDSGARILISGIIRRAFDKNRSAQHTYDEEMKRWDTFVEGMGQ